MEIDFSIKILIEDNIGLLIRILILLNKRNLKINYMNVSKKKYKKYNLNQCILHLKCEKKQLIKLKKIINKLIGVYSIFYNEKKLFNNTI
ncbi:acetolactate synthase [Blattabacterium cuenoti]|uniref:acetolactate synthase n=1 Tax=Blattabacterium cuenoti TaxID=1653831 RepID=UPI00163B721C|nr:acetolactate synthase [Blattabacterium cuenoti]